MQLSREGLLVLLVLQGRGLGPLELFVHLVGDHPAVDHPADHGEQQETLEDPALPPGAHPAPHVGPAVPHPHARARTQARTRSLTPTSAGGNFRKTAFLPPGCRREETSCSSSCSSHSPSISRQQTRFRTRILAGVDIFLA